MNKKPFKLLGLLLIFAGAIMMLNTFSGITGNAIIEDINPQTGTIIGTLLFIGGLILTFTMNTTESKRNLSDKQIRTAKKTYKKDFGRAPNKKELANYLRQQN